MNRKNFYFDVRDKDGHTKLWVEIRSPAVFKCEDLRLINECIQAGSLQFVKHVHKCASLNNIIKTLLVSEQDASMLFIVDNSRWSINEIKKLAGIIKNTPKRVGWLLSSNYKNRYAEYRIDRDYTGCLRAKEI